MPCVGQTPVECRPKKDCKTAKKVSGQHEKKMPVNTWQHKAIKLKLKTQVSKESGNGGPKMVHNNFTVSAQAQLNLNFASPPLLRSHSPLGHILLPHLHI